MKAAAVPYSHELIFLFMGGFMIALSMQRWGLHRRVALAALLLVGDRPARIVGGFMAIAAFLSMWVSNTAAAIMLLPVAVSIIERVARGSGLESADAALDMPGSPVRNFALACCSASPTPPRSAAWGRPSARRPTCSCSPT
jgi:di/tricarboxylate transporter